MSEKEESGGGGTQEQPSMPPEKPAAPDITKIQAERPIGDRIPPLRIVPDSER
jgi:hypothetical protein